MFELDIITGMEITSGWRLFRKYVIDRLVKRVFRQA